MQLTINILFNLLGIFVFAFLFWRKAKEDYLSGQIFTAVFWLLLGIGIFSTLARIYLPLWWFWAAWLGFSAGFAWVVIRLGFSFYETLETAAISILPWLSLIYLADSIKGASWFSLIGFAITLATYFLYRYLNIRYKNYSWYKSGRIGFAGLTSIGVYFLIRGVVAIIFPNVLSFVSDYEPILSGITAFAFFSLLFNLSRA